MCLHLHLLLLRPIRHHGAFDSVRNEMQPASHLNVERVGNMFGGASDTLYTRTHTRKIYWLSEAATTPTVSH